MDNEMKLPPGFRFHPTDEELITHYLSKKALNSNFSAVAISDVDMNRVEPWELPWKAKIGENEWYFFCVKDKKYPTGQRTNRATSSGYWKATGKDKEIFRGKSLVGMRKTLVFYKGRAPKGEKTNWVSHEYRLDGKQSPDDLTRRDWVIMRVFQKSSDGKKVHISGLTRPNHEQLVSSSCETRVKKPGEPGSSHVSCFSSTVIPTIDEIKEDFATCLSNPMIAITSSDLMGSYANGYAFSMGQFHDNVGYQGFGVRSLLGIDNDDEHKLEIGIVSQDNNNNAVLSTENSDVVSNLETRNKSMDEQEGPSSSLGAQDLDCIWNF